jgi:hypothetical protein
MRDKFLVPFYRKIYASGGHLVLDEGRFAESQQKRGRDTIVWSDLGRPLTIEEKIVRFKERAYTSICLETESCTVPGHIARGWMWYSEADVLLYCMQTEAGDLDCLWIDFPKLHSWFWPREKQFQLTVMTTTINKTASRLVPIDRIEAEVGLHRQILTQAARVAA